MTEGEKQMTTAAKPTIGASPPEGHWDAIDWQAIVRQVLRLQMRIAKATRAGRAAGSPLGVFVRLEPYAGKLARTVLRGGWTSNGSSLPAE